MKEKTIFDIAQEVLNCLPPSDGKPKPKKKNTHIDIPTFFEPEIMDCILFMYSCGTCITDISNYVGLSEREVNGVIDAYVYCL